MHNQIPHVAYFILMISNTFVLLFVNKHMCIFYKMKTCLISGYLNFKKDKTY